MPRRHTPLTDLFPFHVGARSNNGDWFQLPPQDSWEIFVKNLKAIEITHGFQTHAFLLMSNHYHWIVSTPRSNLGDGLCQFQTKTSKAIGLAVNRTNRIYGARYKWSLIRAPGYYVNAYRYVYQNPLRAKIVKSVFEYPWSSLNDSRVNVLPRAEFEDFIPDGEEFKIWIDQPPPDEVISMNKLALRKSEFSYPRNPATKARYTGFEFL